MFLLEIRRPAGINHGGLGEDEAAGAAEALGRFQHRQSLRRGPAEVAARRRERVGGGGGRARQHSDGSVGVCEQGRNESSPQATVRTCSCDSAKLAATDNQLVKLSTALLFVNQRRP